MSGPAVFTALMIVLWLVALVIFLKAPPPDPDAESLDDWQDRQW
jgi:hypothetical protein